MVNSGDYLATTKCMDIKYLCRDYFNLRIINVMKKQFVQAVDVMLFQFGVLISSMYNKISDRRSLLPNRSDKFKPQTRPSSALLAGMTKAEENNLRDCYDEVEYYEFKRKHNTEE